MSPYSITRENAARDLEVIRAVLGRINPAAHGLASSLATLQELADSIEEQVEKIDPVEALVQEFTHAADSDAAEFWTTAQWRKHHDDFAASIVEVLRIGVGEATDHDAVTPDEVRVGQYVRIRGHGLFRLISVNTEPGAIGVSKVDGQTRRFCTLTPNCRLADGHADGCKS